jgi:hypothetical protein
MDRCRYLWIVSAILTAGCSFLLQAEEPVVVDLRHDYRHCHVHDRPLLEDLQFAEWEERQELFWPEKDRLFSFAQNDIWLSGNERVDFARVMYCSECRVAKADWFVAQAANALVTGSSDVSPQVGTSTK